MTILVTGVNGQLGYDVMLKLIRRGHRAVGSGSTVHYQGRNQLNMAEYCQMDITDSESVNRVIGGLRPDAVIHCSAWTAVDAAEESANRKRVMALNVLGPRNIAEACREMDIKMIYISTDYVFDGEGSEPWRPEETCCRPLNVYGLSKLNGEREVAGTLKKYFIVRSSWMFGTNGKNFVKTMLKTAQTHDEVRVVSDQIGSPTYTVDLARLLSDMIETDKYGYYHATNEGFTSWYEFCREIYRQYGLKTKVLPVTTEEYVNTTAKRPLNSRLDKSKLDETGFLRLPSWQDAVSRFLKEY